MTHRTSVDVGSAPGHLRRFLTAAQQLMVMLGLDAVRGLQTVRATPRFLGDLFTFRRLSRGVGERFPVTRLYPCVHDADEGAGNVRGQYFHQDLLVARKIFLRSPKRHLDVGSRVDGFVAHVAVFREIEVVDIRPIESSVSGMHFFCFDVTGEVPDRLRGHYDSLSCLHALEHFGLGRYGDPIDPEGHLKGLENLTAILSSGGTLYLSVPIGPQRVEFNSTRVFSLSHLLGLVEGKYLVRDFSFVDDRGDLHTSVPLTPEQIADSFGVWYGCAILELEKR